MNHYNYYITPEEYEIAAKNGICASTLNTRIRSLGWDKQRAITEKPRKLRNGIPKEIVERAAKNGISKITLYNRLFKFGWDIELACTAPLGDKTMFKKHLSNRKRKYPLEMIELAKSNGISDGTFRHRVSKLGWDMHTAATRPPMTKSEIASLTRRKN